MLERPLRILAIALSLIVAAGFLLFVLDDVGRASDDTLADISASQRTAPTPAGEREREAHNSRGCEWIDDANDVLLKPFAGITHSDSGWGWSAACRRGWDCSSTASCSDTWRVSPTRTADRQPPG